MSRIYDLELNKRDVLFIFLVRMGVESRQQSMFWHVIVADYSPPHPFNDMPKNMTLFISFNIAPQSIILSSSRYNDCTP